MEYNYLLFQFNDNHTSEINSNFYINEFQSFLLKNKISKNQLVKLSVFHNPDLSPEAVLKLKQSFIQYFKNDVPALSFIEQSPLSSNNVAIEITYVNSYDSIVFKKHNNTYYTIISSKDENHIFIGGIQSADENESILEKCESTFQLIEDILRIENFQFSHIVRQWNYIEGIISNDENNQHYQIFNDVRTKYYSKNSLLANYPAATGIGISGGGIIINLHAIKKTEQVEVKEIFSSLQSSAYGYSERVLEGEASAGLKTKSTPKFARAKFLKNETQLQVFVSGTASIQGEETVHINDAAAQTKQTLGSINELLNSNELIDYNISLSDLSSVRVYIKNSEDYETISEICNEYLPKNNSLFIVADVCRDNLLVEIEGIACIKL